MHVENCETPENTRLTNPSTRAFCFYVQQTITWSEGQFIKYIRASGRTRQPSFLLIEPCSRFLGFLIDISVVVTFIFIEKLAKLTVRPAYSMGKISETDSNKMCEMIGKKSRMRMGLQLHYAHEVHTLHISRSHCFHFFSRCQKKTNSKRMQSRQVFLPYLGSGFFSSVSILTHCGGSDLRYNSYHGNIEGKKH